MTFHRRCLSSVAFALAAFTASSAWALGLQLGESKEELKLDYEVSVTDHGTGRVTVVLTIADEGRLKPLRSVDLMVPNDDGNGFVDLSVSVATQEIDGNQVARIHLRKELAQRAQLRLNTSHLDGKQTPRTWYYHVIPVADYLPDAERKKG